MNIAIVTPMFDDWESLSRLIEDLDATRFENSEKLFVFVIDDGSREKPDISVYQKNRSQIEEICLVCLSCNLGHQRAIAVGLVEVFNCEQSFDAVVVMDSDGEDRPSDIPLMFKELELRPGNIICARRAKRSNGFVFSILYGCYKYIFRQFTGKIIDFGNFCLIPADRLNAVVSDASIWNNLAASLLRSRIPIFKILLDRGIRYVGTSKMNVESLVSHGLSAIAVYSDVVLLRTLFFAGVLCAISFLGLSSVLAIKFFTSLGIPGWASSITGLLFVIMTQGLILIVLAVFNSLGMRSVRHVIPKIDTPSYVDYRRLLYPTQKSD